MLAQACQGLAITPPQLRQKLKAGGDIADLESGAITPAALRSMAKTLHTMRYAGPQSDTETEARRRVVLKMLQENPNLTHAYTDNESDPEYVILTIGIRGKGTCDLRIRKDRYDGLAVLRLIHELSSRGETP